MSSRLPGLLHPALADAIASGNSYDVAASPRELAESLSRRATMRRFTVTSVVIGIGALPFGGPALAITGVSAVVAVCAVLVWGLEVAAFGQKAAPSMQAANLNRLSDHLVHLTSQPLTPRSQALQDYGLAYVALARRGDPVDHAAGIAAELSSLLDVRLAAVDLEAKLRRDRKRIVTSDKLRTEVDDLRARRDASADESARRQWDRALATAESRLRSAEAADRLADRLDAQIEAIRQQTRLLYESFESSVHTSSVLPSAEAPTIAAFTSEMRAELDAALAAATELDRLVDDRSPSPGQ